MNNVLTGSEKCPMTKQPFGILVDTIPRVHGLILCFVFGFSFVYGQKVSSLSPDVQAHPAKGWDFVRINYPEIALRAHLNGAYIATMDIDSSGKLAKISVTKLDIESSKVDSDIFLSAIVEPLRSTEWLPAMIDGKPAKSTIRLPIVFIALDASTASPVVKTQILPYSGFGLDPSVGRPPTNFASPDRQCSAIIATYSPAQYLASFGIRVISPALIQPVGRFYTTLFDTTFYTDDNVNGLGVIQSVWTPDSRFFVFSVSSYYKNKIEHFATFFYSRASNRIYTLDKMLGRISTSDFRVTAPDSVHTLRQRIDGGAVEKISACLSTITNSK